MIVWILVLFLASRAGTSAFVHTPPWHTVHREHHHHSSSVITTLHPSSARRVAAIRGQGRRGTGSRRSNSIASVVTAAKPVEVDEPAAERPPILPAVGGRGSRLLDVKRASASWQSLPEMWDFLALECGDQIAIIDPIHPPEGADAERVGKGAETRLTYSEVRASVRKMAGALAELGVQRGDCVSIFSENSYRWLIAEQGVMAAGGCNAVRGATAPVPELRYIYADSESLGAVVETPKLLEVLLEKEGRELRGADGAPPKFLMVLFPGGKSGAELQESLGVPESTKMVTFSECLERGGVVAEAPPATVDRSMRATLVYTSGTTGKPKGVVLTHANMLHQVSENSFDRSEGSPNNPWVGDVFVSILPCWHIFERTAEYFTLSRGATMVYSNVRNFKNDLKKFRPHVLIVVPRLLETIWKGVQKQLSAKSKGAQTAARVLTATSSVRMRSARRFNGEIIGDAKPSALERAFSTAVLGATLPLGAAADKLVWSKIREGVGGRVKVVVSGGSSLPSYLEEFFEMAGLRVLVGYGLTETSPVIANRVATANTRGTTGKPVPGSEVKIVHQQDGRQLPMGETGKIMIRGPQVMSGYHNNPAATAQVIDGDGFFDTGDLGRFNPPTGDLIVTGRAKDTIVLNNGENVEPQPLEDAISGECSLVDQVMLFGQDERFLGAVVCVNPSALGAAGLIPKEDADRYSELLGPTPLTTGPAGSAEELAKAEKEMLAAPELHEAVMVQLKTCVRRERPWEQVGAIIIKLEPFTTTNGLITQTLKTKRDVVAERFSKEIQGIYVAKR